MTSVKEIYQSTDSVCSPKWRTMEQLSLMLERGYLLLQSNAFETLDLFNGKENDLLNRVSIERVLSDLNSFPPLLNNNYLVSSKGLELAISHLDVLDTIISADNRPSVIPLQLQAQLYSIVMHLLQVAKSRMIEVKKQLIKEALSTKAGKHEKINFLNEQIISLKQNKKTIDDQEQVELIDFIELELEKWEGYVEASPSFTTASELQTYLSTILDQEINKAVRLDGGYKNFWRDSSCIQPKTEMETQQYIRTLFEPHCQKKSIHISSESVEANGRIDLQFSYLNFKVCMEIKNAHHTDVETAATTQLPLYMEGARTSFGMYLVLWFKALNGFSQPTKYNSKDHLKATIEKSLDVNAINVFLLDCTKPPLPSRQQSR